MEENSSFDAAIWFDAPESRIQADGVDVTAIKA
jgi:hypothetical protein